MLDAGFGDEDNDFCKCTFLEFDVHGLYRMDCRVISGLIGRRADRKHGLVRRILDWIAHVDRKIPDHSSVSHPREN